MHYIGRFLGNGAAPVNTGNIEHRFIVGLSDDVPTTLGQQILLRGIVNCVPPTTVAALGALPDAGLDRPGESVAAGETKWYSFSLAGSATDAALHFLDIDTEGSAGDVSIALFDATGGLAGGNGRGFDTVSSGSGAADQLSFGVGRRASAGGDGRQYDGRNGQLAAGTYYLAVAAQGSTFGNCFTSNTPASGGGSFQLHFHTNVNGAPLAPPIAPLVPMGGVGQDYGTLNPNAGDSSVGATFALPSDGVYWDRFTLSAPVTSRNFLNIDFSRVSTPTVDGVAYIFNSAGNIVYYSDDEGPAALPQFSIGAGGTPPGAHSGLPAGTYYMAVGLFETQDLQDISPSNGRFHVRGTSSPGLTLVADLFTGTVCGTADFDGDGDVGTDRDMEAFFRCLAGTCCPTCWRLGADFNGDGDVGTDSDIEAFFRVLAGNPC